MRDFLAVMTIGGLVVGGFFFAMAMVADAAPAQAAGAALAVACVVLPYCGARAFEMLKGKS